MKNPCKEISMGYDVECTINIPKFTIRYVDLREGEDRNQPLQVSIYCPAKWDAFCRSKGHTRPSKMLLKYPTETLLRIHHDDVTKPLMGGRYNQRYWKKAARVHIVHVNGTYVPDELKYYHPNELDLVIGFIVREDTRKSDFELIEVEPTPTP